jgi:GTP-binding protein Era
MVNAEQGIGAGDRFISKVLLRANADTPVVCAVNKVDRLNNAETAAVLADTAKLEGVDEIFPVSARRGTGVEPLISKLVEIIPEGPFMFPPEQRSDLPSEVLLAELIREQVLRRIRDELPHAVEVHVSEVAHREDGVVEVHAHIWAETESQKGILIGAGGSKIKEIGTAARAELERELGARVFLDLQARVRKRWRRDEGLLDRLGIE